MAGIATAEDISSGQGKLHYMDIVYRVTRRALFGHAVPSVGDTWGKENRCNFYSTVTHDY